MYINFGSSWVFLVLVSLINMVKFCTLNARGLNNFQKRKQLFQLFKHKNLDVIFVQESHAKEEEMHLWRSQWGGKILYANGSSESRGVIIFIKRELDLVQGRTVVDAGGRYIISEITIEQNEIVLCNIYAPNNDLPNFFRQVEEELESFDSCNIVYGGDFNFVINSELDRKWSHHNNDNARDAFMSYAESKEMIDIWRTLNPQSRQFSCCRPNSDSNDWYKFSRLDMFFISQGLANAVTKSYIQTGFQSDHSFVIFELETKPEKRGPGYWKLNNLLLYEKKFVDTANVIIEEAAQINLNPSLKWDAIKGAFIEFAKKFSRDRARDKNKELKEIENRLDILKIFYRKPSNK